MYEEVKIGSRSAQLLRRVNFELWIIKSWNSEDKWCLIYTQHLELKTSRLQVKQVWNWRRE